MNITKKKQLTGYVVKSAIDKTVIVRVDNKKPHPIYKKYVNRSKKYYAHDPNNECNIGDKVSINVFGVIKEGIVEEIDNLEGTKLYNIISEKTKYPYVGVDGNGNFWNIDSKLTKVKNQINGKK